MSASTSQPPDDANEAAADQAAARGDTATARALLEAAVAQQPRKFDAWLKLAAMRRALGDIEGALAAVSGALQVDPLNFLALLSRARLLDDLGQSREAGRAYVRAAAQIPGEDQDSQPAWQPLFAQARARRDQHLSKIAATWDTAIDGDASLRDAERRRLQRFKTNSLHQTRVFHSEPTHYHYPGLVELEFHDPDSFAWVQGLEAATDAIRAEFEALWGERTARAEPYIQYGNDVPVRQWSELNNSLDWTAFHLFTGGRRVAENADRCPATMKVLADIPQPHILGRSPNAMFSLLKPGTHIPPHTGVANTRLVCHLPLIVPPGCWFRVGEERREWSVGKALIFDDTIEHEVANESDLPRVVLIIDAWHPGLSAAEQAAVARIMSAEEAEHGPPI